MNIENDLIKELFETPENDFQSHLGIADNNRIIFSGHFGSGKTTFLKYFFENNKDKYEGFRLAPVNYSISQNDDILQYIKYDILYELLRKPHIEVSNDDVSGIYLITKKEIEGIFKVLLSGFNIIGHDLEKIYDKLKELKVLLDEKQKSINEQDAFGEFLSQIEEKKGSLFENDIIATLVEKVLKRYNESTNKENILIIDDIDRLDPEHTFRILNIFSAHFDEELYYRQGKLNKFGFDKIILVFDCENLKSLFASKYGIDADFNGYIDKFYSREIFFFNNRTILKNHIRAIILKMNVDAQNIEHFGRNNEDVLERIIVESMLSGLSNLRNLKRVVGANIEKNVSEFDKAFYGVSRSVSFFLIKLLYFLFGTSENIVHIIEGLEKLKINLKIDSYTTEIIYCILSKTIQPTFENNQASFNVHVERFDFRFTVKRVNGNDQVKLEYYNHPVAYVGMDSESSYVLLKHLFTFLKKNNYFN